MRHLFAIALIFVSAPAAPAPAPSESWGKVGVTFGQYRQDSIDCGTKGYTTDVADSDAAKTLVRASRRLENLSANGVSGTDPMDQAIQFANENQRIVDQARPEKQFREVKGILQSVVDRCLIERGYSKFRLTDDQRRRLTRLKFGSEKRREYLYSLAVNPSVLKSQSVAVQR
ncbi:MAG TPA: hypothetical protein VHE36_05965 [Sphingomicrobium sp.]|jgi:hypothetical protein|nr:hypothetical protein [Sphingomicrobium sp.]